MTDWHLLIDDLARRIDELTRYVDVLQKQAIRQEALIQALAEEAGNRCAL